MAIAIPAGTWLRGRERRLSMLKSPSLLLNWTAVSLVLLVTVVAMAVPVIAPHDPLLPVGMPLQAPGKSGFPLGSDSIGRTSCPVCCTASARVGSRRWWWWRSGWSSGDWSG